MADVNAGNVKATVKIEYDGSGIDKAKKDLASLADVVGGGLQQSTGSANEALASLDEQMRKNATSAGSLTSGMAALERPLDRGKTAISDVTDALSSQQTAIESAGASYISLQKPIGEATTLLQSASPQMQLIAERAVGMSTQISAANESFTQIGQSLSQSVPLLPQYADSLREVSASFSDGTESFRQQTQNLNTFQRALVDPEPFQMIQSHLQATGQTWSDFSSSIGDDNVAMLDAMKKSSGQMYTVLDTEASKVQATGKAFHESAGSIGVFAGQMDDAATSVTGVGKAINEFGGVGSALYGPGESFFGKLGRNLGSALPETISGLGGVLNDIAMPLMAVQAIGQAFAAAAQFGGMAGQAIYNFAAIAEGPAAHAAGTFTGTVDAVGQSAQKTAVQFSESFGKQMIPTLNALNNEMSQSGDLSKDLGSQMGQVYSFMTNASLIAGGLLTATFLPEAMPLAWEQIKVGTMGMMNMGASAFGMQQPFQGPAPMQQAMQQQIDQMYAMANNPQYLAAQAAYQSAYGKAVMAQQAWDTSHYTGSRGPTDPMNQVFQMQAAIQGGGSYGHYQDPNLAWTNELGMPSGPFPSLMGGCFVAGTQVLMADGASKAIEMLQIGEKVLAHDGQKLVPTTIVALIRPPAKRVYKLTFDDGRTLTLTNSHPLQGIDGKWKSISPEAAKQENPGLETTALQIGDVICTVDGTCTLTSILPLQGVRQVYNITVGAPHTFYAGGILVHNKVLSSGVGTEQVQISHTFVADITWQANNLTKSFTGVASWIGQGLANTFQGIASWIGQGLANTFQGVASWVGQGLANTFQGVASWIGQGLANTFQGVASWVGEGLANTFQGVASWVGSGLSNTFQGVASWIGQNLTNTFRGVASWVGQGLEHTFNAVANWTAQNLTPNFTVNPSFTMLAEGTSNWGGGPAIVGESGPEVVESNGRYTMFDEGATLLNLPAGANVYPMRDMASSSVPQFADGTGGTLTFGIGGMPELTLHVQMVMPDGRVMAEQYIPHIATMIRQQFGRRQ